MTRQAIPKRVRRVSNAGVACVYVSLPLIIGIVLWQHVLNVRTCPGCAMWAEWGIVAGLALFFSGIALVLLAHRLGTRST